MLLKYGPYGSKICNTLNLAPSRRKGELFEEESMHGNGGDVNYNNTICAIWKFIIKEWLSLLAKFIFYLPLDQH
jgi:hypothetical protein